MPQFDTTELDGISSFAALVALVQQLNSRVATLTGGSASANNANGGGFTGGGLAADMWVGTVTTIGTRSDGSRVLSAITTDSVTITDALFGDSIANVTTGDIVFGAITTSGRYYVVDRLADDELAATTWTAPDRVKDDIGNIAIYLERSNDTSTPFTISLRVAETSTAVAGTNYTDPGIVTLAWGIGETAPKPIVIEILEVVGFNEDVTLTLEPVAVAGAISPDPVSFTIFDADYVPPIVIATSETAGLGAGSVVDGAVLSGLEYMFIADAETLDGAASQITTVEWWFGNGTAPVGAEFDALDRGHPAWVREHPLFQGDDTEFPLAWNTATHAPYNDRHTPGSTPDVIGGGDTPTDTPQVDLSGLIETHFSKADLERCRTRADTTPWSGYRAGHDSAVAAGMASGLVSVTDNGGPPGNIRQWATDAPYASGTENYVASERYDYVDVGLHLSKVCNALAMEWIIDADDAAAAKCVALLYHHLGNPAKSFDMTIKAAGSASRNIEIYNTHCGIFRALGLVWGYSGWTSTQRTQILTALRQFLTTHRPWSSSTTAVDTNNIDIWRGAARATAAAIVGDTAAITEEADHLTDRLNTLQHAASSFWKAERLRDRGLFYTIYGQLAASLLARVTQLQLGRDLWTETNGSAGGIEACFDALATVLDRADPVAYWEGTLGYSETEEIGPLSKENTQIDVFELGFNRFGKASYAAVLNRYGRPFPGQYSSHNLSFYIGSDLT